MSVKTKDMQPLIFDKKLFKKNIKGAGLDKFCKIKTK